MTNDALTYNPSSVSDGRSAAAQLVTWLNDLIDKRPVVVGIAPDGMPLAALIADALGAPLDTVAIEALTFGAAPANRFGVAAEGGIALFDPDRRGRAEAEPEAVDTELLDAEVRLQRRSELWHDGHRRQSLRGRNVVLVTELLADERLVAAAACAVRDRGATHVVCAARLARIEAVQAANEWIDEVVGLEFVDDETSSTGARDDTTPVSDETVRDLLRKSRDERRAARRQSTPQ